MSDQLTLNSAAPLATTPADDEQVQLSGDVFGALINLSGRRRFTSQRVVLYAVLASLGHEGAAATARETLALFRDAHTTLIDGKGSLPGVFGGQLRDAYFGTLHGDKTIRGFISLAESTSGRHRRQRRRRPGPARSAGEKRDAAAQPAERSDHGL